MKDINISANCQVIPAAQERSYHQDSDTVILLIHGYTGTPNDMDYLANRIYQETDYSIFLPRLPGHGTNSNDFRQSFARDWLRKIYDSYLNLKSQYKTVYLGGLSMGGLLAILTAAKFNVDKLFLISAALYSHSKLLPYSHFLKYIIPSVNNKLANESTDFATEDEHFIFQNYWKKHYSAQAAELHKLMKLSRKKLNKVTSNTLILASRTDEQVPMKAAYNIKKKLAAQNKNLIIFDKSPHVINNGPVKEKCASEIIKFLLAK